MGARASAGLEARRALRAACCSQQNRVVGSDASCLHAQAKPRLLAAANIQHSGPGDGVALGRGWTADTPKARARRGLGGQARTRLARAAAFVFLGHMP